MQRTHDTIPTSTSYDNKNFVFSHDWPVNTRRLDNTSQPLQHNQNTLHENQKSLVARKDSDRCEDLALSTDEVLHAGFKEWIFNPTSRTATIEKLVEENEHPIQRILEYFINKQIKITAACILNVPMEKYSKYDGTIIESRIDTFTSYYFSPGTKSDITPFIIKVVYYFLEAVDDNTSGRWDPTTPLQLILRVENKADDSCTINLM